VKQSSFVIFMSLGHAGMNSVKLLLVRAYLKVQVQSLQSHHILSRNVVCYVVQNGFDLKAKY